jgi:hypothetical protein
MRATLPGARPRASLRAIDFRPGELPFLAFPRALARPVEFPFRAVAKTRLHLIGFEPMT